MINDAKWIGLINEMAIDYIEVQTGCTQRTLLKFQGAILIIFKELTGVSLFENIRY